MFLPAQEEPNAASSSEAPDLPKSPKSPKARRAKNAAVTSHENQEKNCDFFWDFQWDNDEIIVQLVGQWMKNGWRIDEKNWKNGWKMDDKWMKNGWKMDENHWEPTKKGRKMTGWNKCDKAINATCIPNQPNS